MRTEQKEEIVHQRESVRCLHFNRWVIQQISAVQALLSSFELFLTYSYSSFELELMNSYSSFELELMNSYSSFELELMNSYSSFELERIHSYSSQFMRTVELELSQA